MQTYVMWFPHYDGLSIFNDLFAGKLKGFKKPSLYVCYLHAIRKLYILFLLKLFAFSFSTLHIGSGVRFAGEASKETATCAATWKHTTQLVSQGTTAIFAAGASVRRNRSTAICGCTERRWTVKTCPFQNLSHRRL